MSREVASVDELGPRALAIVEAARELLEERGPEELSMRNLGARVGIRAPSIYEHFASKQALEAVLISIGFEEQAVEFEAAIEAQEDPLWAMAVAYRSYARRHPQLYRLMYDRGLNRELLLGDAEQRAVVPVVTATGGDRDLARATWAFAHGMTMLELNGRFPADADLDAAWRRGLSALSTAGRP